MSKRQPKQQPASHQIGRTVFLILCVLVPLTLHTSVYNFDLLPKRLVLQSALCLIAAFWVYDLHTHRTTIHKSAFYLPLASYLCLSVLAISQAVNPLSAMVAISHQLTFATLFLLATHLFPIQSLTSFCRISASVGIFISLMGILEARGFDGPFPLSNGRPSATFGYRNFAAAFLILNIPLSIVLVLNAQKKSDAILGIISTALMLVFLIYTRTRGAWIGIGCASLLTIATAYLTHRRSPLVFSQILKDRSIQLTTLIAFVVTVALSLSPPTIASQQSRAIDEKKANLLDALSFASTPEADRGRTAMWQHTLDIISDYPLLGIGTGNWQHIYPRYDGGDMVGADSAPLRPHNDYLEIASETGILSLCAYLWLLITIAWVVLRIIQNPDTKKHALVTLAFSAGMLAMLGHSMVSFPNERTETSFLFWFGLGILSQLAPKAPAHPTTGTALHKFLYLVPLLLALCTYLTYRHIQFDRHYLKAFESYSGGDMHGVLTESTRALQWGAFDTQALLLQGHGYQSAGLMTKAQMAYQKGLATSPYNIQLIGALGNTYAHTNKLDAAEKMYLQALDIYPDYHQMDNNLGGIYQRRGDLQKAIAAYKRVIQKSGAFVDAYTNLGLAYVTVDSTAQAIQTYEKALRLAPNDPVIYHDLGEAYYQHAKRDPNALSIAQKAFERFLQNWTGPVSDTQQAHQRLADIQARLKR